MPVEKCLSLLVVVLVVLGLTGRLRVMPFLALIIATALFALSQDAALPWTAKEFNTGMSQTLASSGLVLVFAAMLTQFAHSCGATAFWLETLSPRLRLWGGTVFAFLCGLGGSPLSALGAQMPLRQDAADGQSRPGLLATYAVSASHGLLVPSPLPIAALAILDGDWRLALILGLPLALLQVAAGAALAARARPVAEPLAAPSPAPQPVAATPNPQAGIAVLVACLLVLGLLIAQSLGQNPGEPLGGGNLRENLLGSGRGLILVLVALGAALLIGGGIRRDVLSDQGWLAQGVARHSGLILAVAAAGGFQMVLHFNGMADLVAEEVSRLPPALGVAVPFLIAACGRAVQGSALTSAITAAGIMQPLLQPLGLDSETGRALTVLAIGSGAMATPHVNDGFFWVASHLSGLSPTRAALWVSVGILGQSLITLGGLLALGVILL